MSMIFPINAKANTEHVRNNWTTTRRESRRGYDIEYLCEHKTNGAQFVLSVYVGKYPFYLLEFSAEGRRIFFHFDGYRNIEEQHGSTINLKDVDIYINGYKKRTERSMRYLQKYGSMACLVHGLIAAGLVESTEAPTEPETIEGKEDTTTTKTEPQEGTESHTEQRGKRANYTGAALDTFERIHPTSDYIPNQLYKTAEGHLYYINTHGYMHILTGSREKSADGTKYYCIVDNLLTADNHLHESCKTFYTTAAAAREKVKEMEQTAIEATESRHKYGMRLRGYSIGAQPAGVVERADDPTGLYYDIITYNRELTPEELDMYSLTPLETHTAPKEIKPQEDTTTPETDAQRATTSRSRNRWKCITERPQNTPSSPTEPRNDKGHTTPPQTTENGIQSHTERHHTIPPAKSRHQPRKPENLHFLVVM